MSEWAVKLDGFEPARAVAQPDGLPVDALLELADRVRRWHAVQRPADVTLEVEPGVLLERRWVPLDTIGVYVPRGLLSTLVMTVVPAQVAGVRRIVVCTPPSGAGLIAAAAELLGVDEVWALGGPQAIGFLAYVEQVDKIVGPGNSYVNDAKLEVWRDVPIDLPGGPSEVVVLALGDVDQRLVELELAAQGEHGPDAVCRVVDSLAEAEEIAPEHLVLLGDEAEALAVAGAERRARSSSDAGRRCPRATTPRAATTSCRPAGGRGSVGGLGLETFLKPLTVQRLTEAGLARIRPTVEALAAAENMPAHAEAVRR